MAFVVVGVQSGVLQRLSSLFRGLVVETAQPGVLGVERVCVNSLRRRRRWRRRRGWRRCGRPVDVRRLIAGRGLPDLELRLVIAGINPGVLQRGAALLRRQVVEIEEIGVLFAESLRIHPWGGGRWWRRRRRRAPAVAVAVAGHIGRVGRIGWLRRIGRVLVVGVGQRRHRRRIPSRRIDARRRRGRRRSL